jgi:transposase
MESYKYSSKGLDHLGLVSGLCKELGIVDCIDSVVPKHSKNVKISNGELVLAMILNGLGFVGRTLHMFPQYYNSKPLNRLIGSHIKPEHVNDDALGRCLDSLYDADVSKIYQTLSTKVVKHLGLPCDSLNLDSTSFHVDGVYADDGEETSHIKLTKGYSRDHRPDLNQVVLNLITENQAGIPVYMQASSGNTNDIEGFKRIVKSHIKSLKSAHNNKYLVADSALYCSETIQMLAEQKQLFITRVPQKIKEAKQLIKSASQQTFTKLDDGYHGCTVDSNYADVPQKWLLVKSDAANKRELHTFKKKLARDTTKELKEFNKLCTQSFHCSDDALIAIDKWQKKLSFIQIDNIQILSYTQFKKSGRPKKDDSGSAVYRINGSAYSCLDKIEEASEAKGMFIIATSDCSNKLTMQDMLTQYKSQQNVEKGFRFLKSPDFLTSSLYLKSPARIEALLMIMTSCLMIYAALEHKIRKELKAQDAYFPSMKNKPCQKPTARWVFQCFIGIHELNIDNTNKKVLNLKDIHMVIINTLGPPYQEIYS